jgi:hypothetical protein
MQYFNLGGGNSIRFATGTAAPIVDPDAQAFITAAAITDPTQQSAVNQLVVDLKADGIWSKMKAIYPFVGGTSSTHKFNLKNPLDTDAAFRLVFNGGWTHSSTGATPNGTNAFANTYFSPNPNQTKNNAHLSYYSRTNAVTSSLEIGVSNGGGFARNMTGYNFGGIAYTAINANITSRAAVSNPTTGFLIGSRTTQLQEKYYSSTGLETVNNDSSAAPAISTFSMYLGAVNNSNSGTFYSTKQCAFASIGDGLSDAELANFYTAVQTFNTTLNRQIP